MVDVYIRAETCRVSRTIVSVHIGTYAEVQVRAREIRSASAIRCSLDANHIHAVSVCVCQIGTQERHLASSVDRTCTSTVTGTRAHACACTSTRPHPIRIFYSRTKANKDLTLCVSCLLCLSVCRQHSVTRVWRTAASTTHETLLQLCCSCCCTHMHMCAWCVPASAVRHSWRCEFRKPCMF